MGVIMKTKHDCIFRKMQEQHTRALAVQKASDKERFRMMDEEYRIREATINTVHSEEWVTAYID